MVTKQNAISLAQEFLSEIKNNGLNVRKAFLFGSYALNNQTEDSDIDLAIVADEFVGLGFIDKEYTSKINIKPHFRIIDTRTIPTKSFLEREPFIDEITKNGIELHL